MAFNIKNFQAEIGKHGLSTNNLFATSITLPQNMQSLMLQGLPAQKNTESSEDKEDGSVFDYSRMLTFLTKAVTIPELSLTTAPIQPEGYGNPHRRPTNMEFGQMSMIFMVDSSFRTLTYFQRWLQSIINYDTSVPNGSVDGRKKFFLDYKSNYQATIDVTMYSFNSMQFEYNYRFANAFPINVGEIQLAWENQAEIMLLPVTFTYDIMRTSGMKQGQNNNRLDGGFSFLSRLSQLNTIGQAISTIRKPRSILGAINEIDRLNTIFDNL